MNKKDFITTILNSDYNDIYTMLDEIDNLESRTKAYEQFEDLKYYGFTTLETYIPHLLTAHKIRTFRVKQLRDRKGLIIVKHKDKKFYIYSDSLVYDQTIIVSCQPINDVVSVYKRLNELTLEISKDKRKGSDLNE